MKNSRLITENNRLRQALAKSEQVNSSLREQVTNLEKQVTLLQEQLAKFQTPKHSGNSSLPPSKDENRPKPNQSLRKPTGKKPGGQLGRKGNTLEMTKTPDTIVELRPEYCKDCGGNLLEIEAKPNSVRQIIDIPPVKATYTEYRTFKKACSCGCVTKADFPEGVGTPVSYGSNTEAAIAYFHARQYIPFARMKELFSDLFGLPISEGGIHYLLNRFAKKSNSAYQTIKQRVASSNVIGTDETGVKVNGDKHWFWTWQTPEYTFIAHSSNRAIQTVNHLFPDGFPNSTLVHDGWKPQLNTTAQQHQTCLPHLLRRLNYLIEKYPKAHWAKAFLKLLNDAIKLNKTNQKITDVDRIKIIQRFQGLLDKPPDKIHKERYSFYKRMGRERQQLFIFLFMEDVPPDNNASERAIRNVKVKQKISGQFKTSKAAQNFAMIRSIIDTLIKQNKNILQNLHRIANFDFNWATD